VDGITRIDRLQFDLEVVDFIDKHKNPNDTNTYSNAYLIVDYIYDKEAA
jgi:hypothetical protein